MKKILSIILVLCLCSCGVAKTMIDKKDEYITPINEVSFYDVVNDELKQKLLDIHGENSVANNMFEALEEDLTDLKLNDINGNTFDFNSLKDKEFILEIVQNTCEHCKKQVPLTETILKNEDVVFIQYFAWGTIEEINEFYSETGFDIPEGLIVIPSDNDMNTYVNELKIDLTPTFLFFKEGKIKFACTGDLSYAKYLKVYDLVNNSPLTKDILVTNDNKSVFDLYRSYDDVLADLSNDSKDKLALVENSEEMTVNNIGKQIDYYQIYEKEDEPIYVIDSFDKYMNEPLVVFYVGYIHNNLEDDVKLVNEFARKHEDLNILTILIDSKDLSTSPLYKSSNLKLETDVISSNAEIPTLLLDALVVSYPAAIFIQDNIVTGGCYQFEDIGALENAYEIFMGDDSIALLNNN